MRVAHLSLLCGLLLLGPVGCGKDSSDTTPAASPAALTLRADQVATVSERTIEPEFTLTGKTEAVQSARIKPQIAARIQAQHFRGGETVEEAQLLVELDPADFKANLAAARAALQSAEASVRQAEANWERAESLLPKGYISRLDYDSARASVESARAEVAEAEASLEQHELDLERTRILAPFSGRISPPGHAVGDLVSQLSVNALFELSQLDPIYVTGSVEQGTYNRFALLAQKLQAQGSELPQIKVTLELPGGEPYPHEGVFQAWDHSASAAPGMIIGRTEFPNPDGILLPGQNVTLHGHALRSVTGAFIPQASVQQDQQGHFVMIIGNDGTLQRRNIEVGIRDGADWSVRTGLSPGERVVLQGGQALPPGAPVVVADP
ncbi:efflux RND transporter periplasmic adaptor subunit [Parahaliea aestuarii]|uniref:Efflux RND transporter periplasmic adaptor subunit n=1 Tax=Parahaliea aestuarii TaxID=1852021 RepID=A0A5C8ZU42_9GAMM|nr:efflux RND transporter periplasmic adaptor subunit [Parahaliea aestuarii]TXS91082.1 efflux RND transporter periplasmic adaptor subunit [Parahaliea aestuarii]